MAANTPISLQDAVIKQKITIDTRPISRLIKNPSATEITNYKLYLKKTLLQHKFIKQQQHKHQQQQSQVKLNIIQAAADIQDYKLQLSDSINKKQQRMEYHELYNQIIEYPSIVQSTLAINKLNSEIEKLQQQSSALDQAKELRKKYISDFITLGHQIQQDLSIQNINQHSTTDDTIENMSQDDDEEEEVDLMMEEEKTDL